MSDKSKTILRMPKVTDKIGLKKSSIYQLIKDGKFPKPIQLTANAVGWYEHEVDAWLESRVRALGGEVA
ncbi:helix-turn-helix transcriptional regulator [Thiosulfativibrio zosterae]|uniref:DNA-binding protein n=1 Tax=Thiosulfativibrio zosterae TaxID=2675053 RepID=A0A6F8PR16_9GAMM|nr:AlpA family transcriptional regulator [Thiosulfativibrio zosterae]BBP44555.1 DNA-binding protein [Thiosulfativibrio zosterae]